MNHMVRFVRPAIQPSKPEHINNKMGNASFEEKKEKMKSSKLQSVQNFLEFYGDKEEWTEKLIKERTEVISSLAYNKIWKV